MTTYMANSSTVSHQWYVIDAKGKTLGHLASFIATRLKGKHKPEYTPHVDTGDFIIVINAGSVTVSGNKEDDKLYHHHSGFPGGIKSVSFSKMRDKNPGQMLMLAVKGMMPHNRLGRQMLAKLKVYSGAEHPHQAQQPEQINIDDTTK